jgi:hypothetical protein
MSTDGDVTALSLTVTQSVGALTATLGTGGLSTSGRLTAASLSTAGTLTSAGLTATSLSAAR